MNLYNYLPGNTNILGNLLNSPNYYNPNTLGYTNNFGFNNLFGLNNNLNSLFNFSVPTGGFGSSSINPFDSFNAFSTPFSNNIFNNYSNGFNNGSSLPKLLDLLSAPSFSTQNNSTPATDFNNSILPPMGLTSQNDFINPYQSIQVSDIMNTITDINSKIVDFNLLPPLPSLPPQFKDMASIL